jgi:PAS domain S-box-containing protein
MRTYPDRTCDAHPENTGGQLILEKSLAHYIELYDSAPVGYVTVNSEGTVEEINLTAGKLLGKERNAIISQRFEYFLKDECKDSWNQHFNQTKQNQKKSSFVLLTHRQNGDPLSLQVNCKPYLEEDQHPYFRITLTDITDYHKAKDAELQKLVERYELVLEGAQDAIWDWDVLNKHIHFSSRWKIMRGFADHEVGTDENEWLNSIHPDDKPKVLAAIQAHFEGVTPVFYEEYRVRCKDGFWKWILDRGLAKKDRSGTVIRMAGSENDITVRKNAEAALLEQENTLRLIINSMPALIAYVDTDYRYRRVNTAYEQWFGIPVGEVVGHEVKEIIGDAAWQEVRPFFERAMAGERLHFELQMPYKNVKPRWVHASYVPDKDSAGNVRGIVKLIVDIGEIKAAQQEIANLNQNLQHRIEELEAIFNTAPIGICIANDTSADCIRGNVVVDEMFGLPPNSELSLGSQSPPPLIALIHGRKLSVDELPMQRAARGETVSNLILELVRPDGKRIALLCNAVPLCTTQGQPRGAVGVFQDITTLKKAELALLDSKERLRQAQSAGKLGIYDHNLVTGEMQWDERLRELWGIKTEERVTLAGFLERVHPDDRALLNAAIKQAFAPEGSGEYFIEYRIINPTDNRTTWVAAFGTTTFADGRPVRLVGFVQDISERKVAAAKLRDTEMRLSLAMDELNAGYWDWEIQENTVFFSTAWKRQLGYEDDELPNQYEEWESRLHPDDRALVLATVENHLHNFMPHYELEFRLRHKDGSYRWIHSIAKLTHDQNNRLVRMIGIHLDITEYKQTKENNERREKMEETFRLNVASQTVAAIAHELNQPLIAISYFADASVDMVQKGNPDPQKLITVLENCSEQAQRAGQVIRKLLSVLHKNELINEPMDINKAINAALSVIKTNGRLNADIELRLAVDLPSIMANELQIQKVLVILLQNGLDAIQESSSSSTEGTVTVTSCRDPNTPTQALVTISDTGAGVSDEDELTQMFQPFYSTKTFGLGMGLAICRSLIEAHGGHIWAERNAKRGLSVHFTLPFLS